MHNICYNERQNLWTTKYDWTPIVSENINNNFYSISTDLSNKEPSNYDIWEHSEDVGYDGGHVSNWYNGEQKFEFEFVVSDPIGVNKVFDNLQIVSNNVEPKELEITVIGDDYEFKRDAVTLNESRTNRLEVNNSNPNNVTTTSNIHGNELKDYKEGKILGPGITYKFDKRLKQAAIIKWQPFKDIYKFGRRIGNIQYKEGSWYAQIEPLLINASKEARIRDKWAKIRIRYSGKDLAIIAAIKTLINI